MGRKISTSSDTSDPDSRMISSKPELDENGLVIPKKLYNPCMASAVVKDLRHEIKFNAKAGINVLDNKSELQRAMEKKERKRQDKQRLEEEESNRSPFQKNAR